MAPPVRPSTATASAAASSWRRFLWTGAPPPRTEIQERSQDHFFEPEPDEQLGPNARAAKERGITAVRHKTDCANIPEILAKMSILPGASTGKANYAYPSKAPISKTFLQLTHKANEEGELDDEIRNKCTLFLSLKVLDEPKPAHISRGWLMGNKYAEISASGDSPQGVARVIDSVVLNDSCGPDGKRKPHPDYVTQNEVVYPGPIDISAHLRGIAGPQKPVDELEQRAIAMKRISNWWKTE
jgi:hypothetical protein